MEQPVYLALPSMGGVSSLSLLCLLRALLGKVGPAAGRGKLVSQVICFSSSYFLLVWWVIALSLIALCLGIFPSPPSILRPITIYTSVDITTDPMKIWSRLIQILETRGKVT